MNTKQNKKKMEKDREKTQQNDRLIDSINHLIYTYTHTHTPFIDMKKRERKRKIKHNFISNIVGPNIYNTIKMNEIV